MDPLRQARCRGAGPSNGGGTQALRADVGELAAQWQDRKAARRQRGPADNRKPSARVKQQPVLRD
jgi:hypothetical protein